MGTLENIGEAFFKRSIVTSIVTLASWTKGNEIVSNQPQYRHKELMKHSLEELEAIRNNHLEEYNQSLNQ